MRKLLAVPPVLPLPAGEPSAPASRTCREIEGIAIRPGNRFLNVPGTTGETQHVEISIK